MKTEMLVRDSSKGKQEDTLSNVVVPVSSVTPLRYFSQHVVAFGALNREKCEVKDPKWYVSLALSDLLDDPSVLIEGVLFRARYLGSTQLVCEGQPTKSTRMCQAEEAVSRIKVHTCGNTYFLVLYTLIPIYHVLLRGMMCIYIYTIIYRYVYIRAQLIYLMYK